MSKLLKIETDVPGCFHKTYIVLNHTVIYEANGHSANEIITAAQIYENLKSTCLFNSSEHLISSELINELQLNPRDVLKTLIQFN